MRIKDKLKAKTMEHAVFLACQADLIGEHRECGTLDGYRAHQVRDDDPCRACRRAFTEYAERQEAPVLRRAVLTEAEVRLLRNFDSGRTFKQVLAQWGCAKRTLDEVRRTLYQKLDVAHLPQQSKYQAALAAGRRLGYLRPVPPLRLPEVQPVQHEQKLTDLEVRTLKVLADGTPLSEAGRILGKPSASISARLTGIYRKLDVLHHPHGERRLPAVAEARRRGYDV
jgi:DNA-binding NarL/FixJ family response regulator